MVTILHLIPNHRGFLIFWRSMLKAMWFADTESRLFNMEQVDYKTLDWSELCKMRRPKGFYNTTHSNGYFATTLKGYRSIKRKLNGARIFASAIRRAI